MTKLENSRVYEKDASSPSSRCLGVKIAPEMRSQDRNYMPDVVYMFPLATARSSFSSFSCYKRLRCSFHEHSRKVAVINEKSDNCARILSNRRYWPHPRWAQSATAAKRNGCWSAPLPSYFTGICDKGVEMPWTWRNPTAISLRRSSQFCSSLMGPISTVLFRHFWSQTEAFQ